MTKRMVISFDEKSSRTIDRIKDSGNFSTIADVIGNSLQINDALCDQKDRGFTEVFVRNPKTDEERVMVIPSLSLRSAV